MKSPIEHRNLFLSLIDLIDESGNLIFPDEIQILSFEDAGNGKVKVTIDRQSGLVNTASVKIGETTNYDNAYAVSNMSSDGLSFEIISSFKGSDSGVLLDTGHKYKDDINQITNFPAVLVEVNVTSFTEDNVSKIVLGKNSFFFQVIDTVESYDKTTKMSKLESAQDFVWKKMIEILSKAANNLEMVVDLEQIEIYETVIGKDKKCAVAETMIEISNR